MKLKYIFLTFLFGFMTTNAEWWTRIILFADDNDAWKVLLRYDPNAMLWTDFKKNGTYSTKRAFALGADALIEQIGGNYYHLTPEQIKPVWSLHKSQSYQSDDFVHFVIVPFIPGKILYQQARIKSITEDFAWVDYNALISNQPITKKDPKGVVSIDVDPELREILRNNSKKIQELFKQKQPIAIQQGEWANIPNAIYFYNSSDDYYEFTNFYQSPITLDGKIWPTTEHYYQAMKFNDKNLQEKIRTMQRASDVFAFAQNNKNKVRPDWQNVNLQVMLKANRAKFNQHEKLKKILLDTENKILIENTAADPRQRNDMFFGAGNNFDGKNHLGQILMHVRDELRGQPQQEYQPQSATSYLQKKSLPVTPQPSTGDVIAQQSIFIKSLAEHLELLLQTLQNLITRLQPCQKKESCLVQ